MYANGRGTAKDYTEAARWYRKSADQGNREAMNNLASLYKAGHGVDRDEDAARELYRRSAELGNSVAADNLARMTANARRPQAPRK
jgi:TPR repeat protein